MLFPLSKGKRYFVKTVTFYYVGTFHKHHKDFIELHDVTVVESIEDWEGFVSDKGNPSRYAKTKSHPPIFISKPAVVDVTPWS